MVTVSADQITAYRRDGAVLIEGLFRDWVDVLAAGIERNLAEPGPYAAENLKEGAGGSLTTIATGPAFLNSRRRSASPTRRKWRRI